MPSDVKGVGGEPPARLEVRFVPKEELNPGILNVG